MTARETELTALLIAPDRNLADQFLATLRRSHAFQILADLKSYPTAQVLDIRLRQLKPDVVLLDLGSDTNLACDLIPVVAAARPQVLLIGLHSKNDADVLVRSLRLGATEFLFAPFDEQVQKEVVARLRKMKQPEPAAEEREMGKVLAFSSAKPGSGASTLASQVALALRNRTSKRVLVLDFDLLGGSLGFYLKLDYTQSVLDALRNAHRLDPALWSEITVNSGGLDVMPAPEEPYDQPVDQGKLHDVLTYARLLYDWVIVDLPVIFERTSLMTTSEADRVYVITTPELPSLHLARKAVNLLRQLGLGKDRCFVVVNRSQRGGGIDPEGMEKIFNSPIHAMFPNDLWELNRIVTLGEPLDAGSELGKAVDGLAAQLCGQAQTERRRGGSLRGAVPAFNQS
jgi:pilus assembly protein CpaE